MRIRLGTRIRLGIVLTVIAAGFLLGGIWTQWLLEDRLLQTGAVFAVLALLLFLLAWGMAHAQKEQYGDSAQARARERTQA